MKLQDRTGRNYEQLVKSAQALIQQGNAHPHLSYVTSNMLPSIPLLRFDLNREKAKTLGVQLPDVFRTMSALLSGSVVNDFNMFNRVYRVYLHADRDFRRFPTGITRFHVRGRNGNMVPIHTLADAEFTSGPGAKRRYNMFDAVTVIGQPGPNSRSSDAMAAVEELAREILPPGLGYEWSGISYEEEKAAGQTGPVLAIGALVALLLLAALLESWTAPIAVFLTLALVGLGALVAVWQRGLQNDIYFQIGLVAAVGLAWKQAIPYFVAAVRQRSTGSSRKEAALGAAAHWIRPFLMSSLAFLLVLLPMLLASGPGSASRIALGTGTFGGMAAFVLLGPLFVPVLFALLVHVRPKKTGEASVAEEGRGHG
jgi:multidrug efflux pump subunit AcrB